MSQLFVHQHVFSLRGQFDVTDINEKPVYSVTGSFLKVPKYFTIYDHTGREIAKVVHQPFHFFSTFDVEMNGTVVATIRQRFSFFRSRFDIDSGTVTVQGSWTNFQFGVFANGQQVASIHEDVFSFGHAYELDIEDDDYEGLVVALVLAIDYAKSQAASGSAASSAN
ncbi:LURP-one-related/scramblase family protein [Schleiferilactobacillus perolens]|jgi:uncharacterized protein YxjI|nr:LURP-one-related family protein [Schleiferilactobacillus perolens]MCI1892124.1 LURP-one-related family protein [Schleiferilactobacillus harbinensis]MCI1911724.1 LURP-one-related family protein [Schleiferilactobacillus harbinensis]MCI2171731.1 LURP-one-related family protein [Schleiferilactobacillus perolens]